MCLKQKRLLVLGGTNSTIDVVRYAKELGIYTIVTDNLQKGISKELADEAAYVSTADIDGLVKLIKEKHIDGVLTGASEFNISNCITAAEAAEIPFYTTREQWNLLSNKKSFKDLCRKHSVPCVCEYDISNPDSIKYPVIVKPVDLCSAKGISVCEDRSELDKAVEKALRYSASGNVILEQYVENDGTTVSARYILKDGSIVLHVVGDRYVLGTGNVKSLITWASYYPSKHTGYYIDNVNNSVVNMFKKAGLENGCLFMEALPMDEGIYFYEMGYRISGGLTYNITEITNQVNELKMLINYSVSGIMCDDADMARIDPYLNGKAACTITIPLEIGTIGTIEGIEQIREISELYNIAQYYQVGDEITTDKQGTLDQLFARFILIADNDNALIQAVNKINEVLSIKDIRGRELYTKRFNPKRFIDS